MTQHQHKESYIIEYGLKAMMIFYFISVLFYPETLDPANNFQTTLSFILILRLIVIIAFSIFILAVSHRIFKTIAFSAIIIGAFYKVFMLLSQDTFYLHHLLTLGDSVMIIGIANYYLYRNKLKEKYVERKKSKRKLVKKLSDDVGLDE